MKVSHICCIDEKIALRNEKICVSNKYDISLKLNSSLLLNLDHRRTDCFTFPFLEFNILKIDQHIRIHYSCVLTFTNRSHRLAQNCIYLPGNTFIHSFNFAIATPFQRCKAQRRDLGERGGSSPVLFTVSPPYMWTVRWDVFGDKCSTPPEQHYTYVQN